MPGTVQLTAPVCFSGGYDTLQSGIDENAENINKI